MHPKMMSEGANHIIYPFNQHKCKITDPLISRVKVWVVLNREHNFFNSKHLWVVLDHQVCKSLVSVIVHLEQSTIVN